MRKTLLTLLVLFGLTLGQRTARVRIVPGAENVQGELGLQEIEGGITVQGTVTGLTPGLHGFHIHEKGELGNKCVDAGPHFNPFMKLHGDPKEENRHVGDLGNIYADPSGVAVINIFDPLATLDPASQAGIGNRAIVIHAKPDDLGRGSNEESLKTGNAGPRVGCGIIQVESQVHSFPFPAFQSDSRVTTSHVSFSRHPSFFPPHQ